MMRMQNCSVVPYWKVSYVFFWTSALFTDNTASYDLHTERTFTNILHDRIYDL